MADSLIHLVSLFQLVLTFVLSTFAACSEQGTATINNRELNTVKKLTTNQSKQVDRLSTTHNENIRGEKTVPMSHRSSRENEANPLESSNNDRAMVAGVRLTLSGCELTIEREGEDKKVKKLPLPDGCAFVKKEGAGVQIETTKEGRALLVVSSRSLPGRPGNCDTRVRAIVVTPRSVLLSADEQTIRMCGSRGPFDIPMFIVLSATATPI